MGPCKNPSCTSFGMPHPNCQCGYAEGGLIAGAEGFAEGLLGPVATAAEVGLDKLGVPGFSAQEIESRKEQPENLTGQIAGTAAGFVTPFGLPGKIAQGAKAAANLAKMGKVGTSAIQGFIQGGLIQGSNEASKWLLTGSNPEYSSGAALSRMGAMGLFTGIVGGAAGLPASKAKQLHEASGEKLANYASSFLAGFGYGKEGISLKTLAENKQFREFFGSELKDLNAMKAGVKAYEEFSSKFADSLAKKASQTAGGIAGISAYSKTGSPLTGLGSYYLTQFIQPIVKQIMEVPGAKGRDVAAVAAKWLSTGAPANSLWPTIQRFNQVEAGNKLIDKAVNSAIHGVSSVSTPLFDVNQRLEKRYNDRQKLKEYIENGGMEAEIIKQAGEMAQGQNYAHGGEITLPDNPLFRDNRSSETLPEVNILLSSAKMRVSNYLRSMQPPKYSSKLAFDKVRPSPDALRSYDEALDIAIDPLSIVGKISEGRLMPRQVKHLVSMYPETYQLLQHKFNEAIVTQQMEDKRPPSQIRQSLSLFMNAPLSSDILPESIFSVQSSFYARKQQIASTAQSKSTALPKIAKDYLSPEQAREARYQRQKT